MRHCYIISYDICDEKRWRQVFKMMNGFGERIQYSVFRAYLNATEKAKMKRKLDEIIHHREDKVMIVDLGQVSKAVEDRFEFIGLNFTEPEKHANIL